MVLVDLLNKNNLAFVVTTIQFQKIHKSISSFAFEVNQSFEVN